MWNFCAVLYYSVPFSGHIMCFYGLFSFAMTLPVDFWRMPYYIWWLHDHIWAFVLYASCFQVKIPCCLNYWSISFAPKKLLCKLLNLPIATMCLHFLLICIYRDCNCMPVNLFRGFFYLDQTKEQGAKIFVHVDFLANCTYEVICIIVECT